jgi:ATP-dependent helicase Lhr and Lhr-like helicase
MVRLRAMPLSQFHPLIAKWFQSSVGAPTDVQAQAWPAIQSGRDVLIAAPTGSGKTFAAFLSCIDHLFKQALARELDDHTQVLYVSPLKALSNDIQKNLQLPLAEIGNAALSAGLLMPELRVLVRTGDTPMTERQQMLKRPPHILVTTPESLFILLTAEKSRRLLQTVRTIIVDEIHAVVPNKRGAHLALSLERLEALTLTTPQRIGLSATQRPIETVARFLVGNRQSASSTSSPSPLTSPCTIIDVGHKREMDLAVEVPKDELSGVATNTVWADVYDRIAELVRQHRSTLVFVNTRRLAERVSHALEERLRDLGADVVAAHHGSLSRQIRLSAEERLKSGKTRVVVATASLELGIDIGAVDLVCQIGSPRAIATGLQRVGRAGHWIKAIPKGRLFAMTRDDLLECAALIRAIRTGVLDRIAVPPAPLDILAQQVVAAAATQTWQEDELFDLCRRADPYRALGRSEFNQVLRMLADGIATNRGRGLAHVFHDRINRRIKGRRGARLAAITSGGAIPDTANYAVVSEPEGTVVGSVDEDFAVESLAGDIMLLGNTSWRIKGVEMGKVRVEDAHGAPPNIPFWRGEAPSRTAELSSEVARLRSDIDHVLEATPLPLTPYASPIQWLRQECGLDQRGAQQAIEYVLAGKAVLGTVPTQQTIVAERFFDESGGMQLILHAPFGGRINRAWGLALRKRFCVTFDFELQAAATDNGIVISLGEKHSFPLDSVFGFLHSHSLGEVLLPAVLQAPMFMTRWRWNVSRALVLLRFSHGKKVAPQIQRMKAEDLLGAVFPDAIACQDNMAGERTRQIPDHPLVNETLRDCFTEAMDLDGLTAVFKQIEAGTIRCVAVDTPVPSPFSHEILNANPYAFLDDAPLEERRARAVEMRRTLPAQLAGEVGALDHAAIEEVQRESWPVVRDPDELHDALLTLLWLPEEELQDWAIHLPRLIEEGRALELHVRGEGVGVRGEAQETRGWVATEYREKVETVLASGDDVTLDAIVLGWMESVGPTMATELATRLHCPTHKIDQSLVRLEASGQVLRGQFRPISPYPSPLTPHDIEFCHRRLLARIHRLTIGRLRKEVEPVTATEFMRFLFQWQHVAPGSRLHGEAGLLNIVAQLAGFETAASAWEPHVLRARLAKYEPELLDRLCLSGAVSWGRLSPHPRLARVGDLDRRRIIPTSVAPISLFPREESDWLRDVFHEEAGLQGPDPFAQLSSVAQDLRRALHERGASFFADLVRMTNHLPTEVEEGLWELVAAGLVTADGFDNLRALMDPRRRRAEGRERSRRPRHSAGRWSLLRQTGSHQSSAISPRSGADIPLPLPPHPSPTIEPVARQLLRRYGVVFRDLLVRESLVQSWRDLLVQYRRMELQGEIRGGRFVNGFTGEQFALPEAVESLRAVRKRGDSGTASHEIKLSASDPLNLAGIILPGPRVPAVPSNFVLFKDGMIVRTVIGRGGEEQPVGLAQMAR